MIISKQVDWTLDTGHVSVLTNTLAPTTDPTHANILSLGITMLLMLKWHWPQVSKNMCYVFSLQLTTLESSARPIDFSSSSSSCLPESEGIWFHHDGMFLIFSFLGMVLVMGNGSSGCWCLICGTDVTQKKKHICNSMYGTPILMCQIKAGLVSLQDSHWKMIRWRLWG